MSPGRHKRTNRALGGRRIINKTIHPAGFIIFFVRLVAELIIPELLPASCHYISSLSNYPQRLSTAKVVTGLKLVELLVVRLLPTPSWGRSRTMSGGSRSGLKRSVRVQAFTCSRSL